MKSLFYFPAMKCYNIILNLIQLGFDGKTMGPITRTIDYYIKLNVVIKIACLFANYSLDFSAESGIIGIKWGHL